MGRIFYIMGKSSTGKDTIYKRLLERCDGTLRRIIMYTTRPIREGECDGVEYFFVDEERQARLAAEGRIIELRSYHTFHGVWNYFTVKDEQIDLERYDYLMIGTLESYAMTRDYFGGEKIVPLYIDLDDGVRLQRALDREKLQKKPRYQELCRRYLADEADFSPQKLAEAEITKRFYNDDLERCLSEIERYIEERR
ncbi:MAG: guanylate kinase [Lachnospiraceae bacterium]|nr:guanylate kinase [Lachnospiraceae bacterium]